MQALLLQPLIALGLLALVMAWAWRRQQRTRNAGVVDLIWAASLGVLAVVYASLGDGWTPRRILVALLAGSWSARLTWHMIQRLRSEDEDGRYRVLRERWGENFEPWMFWFYQLQAVLAVLLSLTYLVLCDAQASGWRAQDAAAIVVWAIALLGEGLADRQLRTWRAHPAHRGQTCRSGLWSLSRHPNYFFEWIGWFAYPLLGIGLPLGWALWLTPALMLFLVLKVTGIPPTEEQSLRSRGDDYRAYQASTNAFFPGPSKLSPERLSQTP